MNLQLWLGILRGLKHSERPADEKPFQSFSPLNILFFCRTRQTAQGLSYKGATGTKTNDELRDIISTFLATVSIYQAYSILSTFIFFAVKFFFFRFLKCAGVSMNTIYTQSFVFHFYISFSYIYWAPTISIPILRFSSIFIFMN